MARFEALGYCPFNAVSRLICSEKGDTRRIGLWGVCGTNAVLENMKSCCACNSPNADDIAKVFGEDPVGYVLMREIISLNATADIVLIHPVCKNSGKKAEDIVREHPGAKLLMEKYSGYQVVVAATEDLSTLDFGKGTFHNNNDASWTAESIYCGGTIYDGVRTAIEVWVWKL